MMDAQAIQVASVSGVEVKDISQPEICSICDQVRAKHKQFHTCMVCYTKRRQEDIFVMVEC